MSDFQGETSPHSSDGDRYTLDDDYEGGPAWETAPDNDDEDGDESDDNDAFSEPPEDHDPNDGRENEEEGGGYDEGEADGDFEDAWLDDYLPGESVQHVEDRRLPLHHIEEIDNLGKCDNRTASGRSLSLEEDTSPSLMVVDADGGAQAEVKCTIKFGVVVISAKVEKARDTSAMDQARIRQLNEKLQQMNEKLAYFNDKQLQFDTVERENRSLREDTQKHKMQALSSSELVKTLRDQLALTSKSEEQLKLQTKQLMEQNQTLQSDLLEKIAAETTKFQKMARLSAENESLVEELERKENAVSDRVLEQRQRMSKLQLVLLARDKMTTRRALSKWQFGAKRVSNHENVGRAQQLEANLTEAKECVFSLSRAKTKLEEKLQAARDEVQRLTGELTESGSELQLVKHGFVTTVIRDVERAWLRAVLTQWRIQTHVSAVTKELRLQVEMAELKASERDKYSKSLDDYSRVLRSDLERFQFFSLDKRITVDVLSKKLLREEERYRHMEERHVALEEKAHALKSQLASFVEWDGLALPFSVLALCKDAAVANLRDIFLLHAAGNTGIVEAGGITKEINGETPAPRLAMPSLVRLLEYSTLLEEEVIEREAIAERLARHLPPYAVERGLLFADFITGLNQFLTEVLASSNTKHEQLKRFWSSLLSLVGTSHVPNGIHIPVGEIGSTGSRSSAQSGEKSETGNSWAGRLSDDILQNQEKLLAMLEHETAVVERAVMDKVSLKHAYPASEHSSAGSVSRVGSCGATTFLEYQCDPLLPPEPGKVSTSPVDVSVLRMLTDLKLHPTFLSQDMVQALFNRYRETSDAGASLLAPQGFTLLVGSCALDLYARSLAESQRKSDFLLSAREVLLSFFNDLGLVAESDVPPATQLCFVGLDIEAMLWPLFEYYANSADAAGNISSPPHTAVNDSRVGMTASTFERFMSDIAGKSSSESQTIFRRVMQSCSSKKSTTGANQVDRSWRMHLDEFYIAISYVQVERSPGTTYATPGEAVRQWLQQTQ
ncbi:hypothetical protein PHYBOEH_001007 [Phytophthora boehmeriae]|uniref:Uncharacterized protein n=1 Tax=Phytophthora boehmeriae TaxID=109152 RepID=A0A8T1X5J2_9STRA|nr:hypothetical protein PHYBOEH_001007 [Phytophthora boehmeriae]